MNVEQISIFLENKSGFIRVLVFLVFSVLPLVIISGCGARYTVNGETFGSSSEALQKQGEIMAHVLNKITPTNNPVHGKALVLIPSDVEIQKNYIRSGSNASGFVMERIDYLIMSLNKDFQFMADTIRKRGIFDSISVERHNGNPATFPLGDYDFMVIRDVDGWAIKSKAAPRPLPIALEKLDKNNPDSDARIFSFLDSISQQATALRSK
jgi:hypothetical protein